jgi:hypothetical protein
MKNLNALAMTGIRSAGRGRRRVTGTTQDRVLTKVVRHLLVQISDETDENLFREKLRSAPVDMKVDAVLVLRVLVLEIVGKSGDG